MIIAHRTCPLDAAENSLDGLLKADTLGADAVEVDVRRCWGGVPVLMHDPIGWRTARWPWPVRLTALRQFRNLRLRGSDEFAPTLAAAAAALPEGMTLAVDVKDPGAMVAVIDVLEGAGLLNRSLLWCRQPDALRVAGERAPRTRRALLGDPSDEGSTTRYLQQAADLGVDAVSLHERVTTSSAVEVGHHLGLTVYSWAKSARAHQSLLATGVDGLVTDWPALARRLVG